MGDGEDRPVTPEEEPVVSMADDSVEAEFPNTAAQQSTEPEGEQSIQSVIAPETEPADDPSDVLVAEPAEPADPNADPVDEDLAALEAELAAEPADPVEAAAQPETESLDDIEPATATVNPAEQPPKDMALPSDSAGIPLWPFWVYLGLWVVLVGIAVWQFLQIPAGSPISEAQIYSITILVGLVMTAVGPLLALAVWLAVWLERPGRRAGLFSRTFIIGAASTLVGVTMWWVALMAVDMARLGRFF